MVMVLSLEGEIPTGTMTFLLGTHPIRPMAVLQLSTTHDHIGVRWVRIILRFWQEIIHLM